MHNFKERGRERERGEFLSHLSQGAWIATLLKMPNFQHEVGRKKNLSRVIVQRERGKTFFFNYSMQAKGSPF